MTDKREVGTLTDLCSAGELPEVEIISLVEEQIPRYKLRADTLTEFGGYDHEDWFVSSPALKIDDADLDFSDEQKEETLSYFLLCSERVSQMTKTYNDIEAVTKLLEEKEKDLELAARIGKTLLASKKTLEEKLARCEVELVQANDAVTQLRHDLTKKSELLQIYTNDVDEGGSEAGTPVGFRSINTDLLQRKIASLEEENIQLQTAVSQMARCTDETEEKEQQLLNDLIRKHGETHMELQTLEDELAKKSDENSKHQEEITGLLAQVVDLQSRSKKLAVENEELTNLLHVARECQNDLAKELSDLKDTYVETLDVLHDTQEQLRMLRKKGMPSVRSSPLGVTLSSSHYNPDSLASELQFSLKANSAGLVHRHSRGTHYERVFETVRSASKAMTLDAANPSHTPSYSRVNNLSTPSTTTLVSSSRIQPSAFPPSTERSSSDLSSSGYHTHSSGFPSLDSCNASDSEWSGSAEVDEQSLQLNPSRPSSAASNLLQHTLQRITPADLAARRARLTADPCEAVLAGCRTPDSIMSTDSSGRSGFSGSSGGAYGNWRLPEKLQIIKPMEGSQTLRQWSLLATPHLGSIFEERPGVQVKGGCGLEDLGFETYNLYDLEEDEDCTNPGKSFQGTNSIYTFTNSTVLHPEDQTLVTPSVTSAKVASVISTDVSRDVSAAATPAMSRRNSCSTFSTTLGLAKLLNERGIGAVTPSVVSSPASEKTFSLTATPCNSPDGTPPGSPTPEQSSSFVGFLNVYNTMTRGVDMLRRTFSGDSSGSESKEKPCANRKPRKKPVSKVDQKVLTSFDGLERVERAGVENVMTPCISAAPLTFRGPLYMKRTEKSPMAQLTSLKLSGSLGSLGYGSERNSSDSAGTPPTSAAEKMPLDNPAKRATFDLFMTADEEVLSARTSPTRYGVPGRPNSGALEERLKKLGPLNRQDLGTVTPQPNSYQEPQNTVVGTIGSLFFGRKGGLL